LPPGAIGCASRVLAALRRPIAIDGQDLAIDAAIGISFYPAHGDSADALWRAAQAALLDAKRTATGYVVHAGGGGDRPDHLTLGQDLHQAAQNNEFELHYQPVIGVRQRRVVGVEALVRWRHPRFGLLFPDAFVPLAEQIGAIDPMTDWVLGAALQQLCAWQKQGHDFTIAVNVSALTLRNSGFPVTVERLLGQWRVRPDRLVLEVTESAIIQDTARAVEIINRLHAIGVVVSIDDFGTGYTSLAYLRKLPVQELKIDKSFIKGLRTNSDDAIITRTIIELGHNLGLRVVAEGVEDSETFDMLDDLGCDVAQGYHMSRPVDAASLRGWLATSAFGDNRAPGGKAALGGKRGAPQVRDASGAPADENATVPERRQPRKKAAANRHKTARAACGAKVKDAARKKSRRWRVKPAATTKA
jgi:EAL domain-containing protein (putative c-di-GMP-specific phosphodiesterase class I)